MKPPSRTPGELTDIEVERLDAVDKPATRRRWLIVKSSEGAVPMDPKELEKAALALVENLTKDAGADGLAMSEASLGAINSLAKSLGLTTAFKAKAAPPPPQEPEVPPAAPEEDPLAKRLDKMESGLTAVAKSVDALVAKMDAPAPAPAAPASPAAPAPTPVAKSVDSVPPSAQAKGQDSGGASDKHGAPELGKGLFTNIVFQKTAVCPR